MYIIKTNKLRLDHYLVTQQFATTVSQAQRYIGAG